MFLSRGPDEHDRIVLISGRPKDPPFDPINQISPKADSLATLLPRLAAHARTLPGLRPREQWRAEMAQRMGVA